MFITRRGIPTVILLLGALLAGFLLLIIGDRLFGRITGISDVRQASQLFRSEAAPYALSTSVMVPNLRHSYERQDGSGQVRLLRTGPDGTILGSEPVPNARTTILFLGGSTTESNEVEEENRFPAVVQKILRDAGADVRTLNAGVRGHTSQDSIIAYLSRPTFRYADIVIIMHSINDRLWLSTFYDYSSPLPKASPTSASMIFDLLFAFTGAVWDFISYKSNVLFALRQQLTLFDPWTGERRSQGVVSEETLDHAPEVSESRAEAFEANLRTLVAIVRASGALPVLMTQPLGRPSSGQNAFNDIIRRVTESEGAHLIDLDAALTGERSWAFFGDSIHFNDRGSKAVGGIIAAELGVLLDKNIQQPEVDTGVVDVERLLARCAAPPDDNRVSAPGPVHQVLGRPGRYPSFSPDGAWMLFQTWQDGVDRLNVYRRGEDEIIELSPAGITTNERHPAFLSASDETLSVVFGSGFTEHGSGLERLMVRRWPSMRTTRLIEDEAVGGAIPAVGKTQIVFPGFTRSGHGSVPDLMTLELGRERPDTLLKTPHEEWRPALAPDGTIYYISNPNGNFDIFSLPPNSSQPKLVFSSDADEWDPAVSPDGRWLAFASRRHGTWNLALLDTKTNRPVDLTSGPKNDWDPSFHPSGRLLVFARHTGVEPVISGLCPFGEEGQPKRIGEAKQTPPR